MLKQFLHHLSTNALVSRQEKVLLAVSGGLDSMVMLDLFLKSGFKVAVAHVNFQLRGEESEGDERFVRSICEQQGIPFYGTRFETDGYAQTQGLSIQMAARELRYTWFNELMETNSFDKLATAHHINDSIETVLLNWVHGNSLHGFAGIPSVNGKIVRPLLFATREQLAVYAKESSIGWREDSSNETDDYQRNFIRHRIVPLLRELNPSLEETFLRGQRKLTGELDFFEEAFLKWKDEFVKIKNDKITIRKEGLSPTYASLLYKVVAPYGFNFDVCEEAMQAFSAQPGKRFLSASHELIIDRAELILMSVVSPLGPVRIDALGKVVLGDQVMELSIGTHKAISTEKQIASLDSNKIEYPLCWRPWREGDYFYPLGMKHRKKVSDFLIDSKVSLADKRSVTVLESGGEIVWLVGYRIDDRYRLSDTSTESLVITVSVRQ